MSESEARSLMEQAAKKATSKGWFGFGGPKYDEAADLYRQAGNGFKLGKKWNDAGHAYLRAAELLMVAGEKDEAANQYIAASKCYKKGNPEEAIQTLRKAVEVLNAGGRFYPAANHQKDIAQLYETELLDPRAAMDAYEAAAELYSGEESVAQTNNCLLKVAAFAAQLEQYPKAMEIFERIAAASVDNQLTKWSVKEYLLKAGICRLAAGDDIATQNALHRYQEMDVAFGSTRECKLLVHLADAARNHDVDAFTHFVFEYDQMTKLDNWKTTILLRVKKALTEEEVELT
ncbi:vesicular-fusion protein S17 [Dimargaris cristalligena]|uniref:Soluble NSF attachment protein n=1 Tax=Dimargaris cristalligena TaxID=215637 RepID=A0A4Q0A2E3_9FUNG|nr:vesicular-fusion protein S17 [Dimargaris cristalligena]RKP39681.1 soluble NSF attachment protein [Dimargaris cristalligena]|eukprot:RKP39681.1 soluble NSF attachment protein [Dimargaris cristalligena]